MGAIRAAFEQDISGCLAGKLGADGLSPDALKNYLSKTEPAISRIRRAKQDGALAFLDLWLRSDDLAACRPVIDLFAQNTTDIVILGTGGSSLGAQALAQLAGYRVPGSEVTGKGPRFHFFDNLDPDTFGSALAHFNYAKTRFLLISKSGSTAETMIQALVAIDAAQVALGAGTIKDHFVAITMPGERPLRRLAEKNGFLILDHDPDIGGRFSVLSNVGLLPAMLMGLDAKAVRQGAGEVMKPILEGGTAETIPPAQGAALAVAARDAGLNMQVLMPYADRLELFALWYRQLWAESLGKEGQGTTPIQAVGPVDQHSQLQLYLAGPKDKLFTLITLDQSGTGPGVKTQAVKGLELAYLASHTIGDLVDAQQRATAETLLRNGRPVRTIHLPELNERAMGALFMHFMLETIIAAQLMKVDPFDQPAVEEGKVLAKQYLSDVKA